MEEINQPIPLYDGPIGLEFRASSISCNGSVNASWLPSPRIAVEMETPDDFEPPFEGCQLHLTDIAERVSALIFESARVMRARGEGITTTRGIVDELVVGDAAALGHVVFHVPNLVEFDGSSLETVSEGRHRLWRGRLVMRSPVWTVIVDGRPDLHDFVRSLRGAGGYLLTHTGRLERTDGASFVPAQARVVLKAIGWLLSFARGIRVAPILPIGFGLGGEPVWQEWRNWSLDPWSALRSWFPVREPSVLGDLFPEVVTRMSDPEWEHVLTTALSWYLQANTARAAEPAVASVQSALELLSWAVLVQDGSVLSEEGFGKLSAHDNLRLLLAHSGVPRNTPSLLKALHTRATADGLDGPNALTAIRNRIVHPPRRGQSYALQQPQEVIDALHLGLWYTELVLLRCLQFAGPYVNRVGAGRFSDKPEPVPWS